MTNTSRTSRSRSHPAIRADVIPILDRASRQVRHGVVAEIVQPAGEIEGGGDPLHRRARHRHRGAGGERNHRVVDAFHRHQLEPRTADEVAHGVGHRYMVAVSCRRCSSWSSKWWKYLTAKLTGTFNERADPKVQLEQAITEAQVAAPPPA